MSKQFLNEDFKVYYAKNGFMLTVGGHESMPQLTLTNKVYVFKSLSELSEFIKENFVEPKERLKDE